MVPDLPRNLSTRFLSAQEMSRSLPHRAWGPSELFAEVQWPMIRATLEREGSSLGLAKRNAAALTGHCPLAARRTR